MNKAGKADKITLKVNRINVSRYREQQPPASEQNIDRAKIKTSGPLYPANDVLALLDKDRLTLWTRKCQSDVTYKLELDIPQVANLVRNAVANGKYIDSEWCIQNPSGPIAACDAYQLNTTYFNEATGKYLPCEYFVKFAISETDKLLLLVSCHV